MKYLSLFSIFVAFAVFAPGQAQAHMLEKDDLVQGVMHLNPSHEPTAGEPAQFEFFMSGVGHSFDPEMYRYTLVVEGANDATGTAPVMTYGSTLKAAYTFPKEGDYTATLSGSSTEPGTPDFTLNYDDITVLPPGQHENPIASFFGSHGAHALLTGILVLMLLGVVVWEKLITPRLRKKS